MVDSPAQVAQGDPAMNVQEFVALVKEVRDEFAREKDQGLMKDQLRESQHALAGEHACDRILRRIEARTGVHVLHASNRGRAR